MLKCISDKGVDNLAKVVKKSSKSKIIMIAVTVLFVSFIFFQSSKTADVSGGESEGITDFLNNLFVSLKLNIVIAEGFLRKVAHFAEFFILGCLLTATEHTFTTQTHKRIFTIFFFGLATAVCDETLQLFISGRAGLLTDALIDFSGILCGTLISLLFLWIKKSRHR